MKRDLRSWVEYLTQLHVRSIDLELGRMQRVAEVLSIQQPACPVITVAGTNGKGSVVGFLEAYYVAMGLKVAAYTSPYLISFNEQFRINQLWISDEALSSYFEKIDYARGEITLTLFEFKTLAAFLYFADHVPDIMILEVGLGGRLDSVNMFDPDIAVITSIGLDHCDWLGNTRELIACEKAGIFRCGKLAVCGDLHPPVTIQKVAHDVGAQVFYRNKDFFISNNEDGTWTWQSNDVILNNLPEPILLKDNIATGLMVIELIEQHVGVGGARLGSGRARPEHDKTHQMIATTTVPGRQQIISHNPFIVVDVSHNEDSVRRLTEFLKKHHKRNVSAVFSVLNTKDFKVMASIIASYVSEWHIAEIQHPDAMSIAQIEAILHDNQAQVFIYPSITEAYKTVRQLSNNPIVAFGSFHVVAEVLACQANNSP